MGEAVNIALLRQELRELRAAVDRLAPANTGVTAGTRSGGKPPGPTGLTRATGVPGAITLTWNPSTASDLSHYLVEVSTNSSFTSGFESFRTTNTRFEYTTGTQGVEYWARVKAVNSSQNESDPTSAISSLTGQVETPTLAVGAASEIARFAKSSGFTTLNGAAAPGNSQIFGPILVTSARDDAVILPLIVFEADLNTVWVQSGTNYLLIELLRRRSGETGDTVVDSVQPDMKSDIPEASFGTARTVLAAFTTFDTPGAGEVEYRVRLTAVSSTIDGNSITLTPTNITVEMTQLK